MGWVTVMEAVTDASGTFAIPAWGPKRLHVRGAIGNASPALFLFKTGYVYERLTDRSRRFDEHAPFARDRNSPNPMRSYWNGKTIALKRFTENSEAYAESLRFVDVDVAALLETEECNWKEIPHFLLAIDRQSRNFEAQRTRWQLPTLKYLSTAYSRPCGPFLQFVEEHGK